MAVLSYMDFKVITARSVGSGRQGIMFCDDDVVAVVAVVVF